MSQYAATKYAARASGMIATRIQLIQITTPIRPNVATPSLRSIGKPARTVVDIVTGSSASLSFGS